MLKEEGVTTDPDTHESFEKAFASKQLSSKISSSKRNVATMTAHSSNKESFTSASSSSDDNNNVNNNVSLTKTTKTKPTKAVGFVETEQEEDWDENDTIEC